MLRLYKDTRITRAGCVDVNAAKMALECSSAVETEVCFYSSYR